MSQTSVKLCGVFSCCFFFQIIHHVHEFKLSCANTNVLRSDCVYTPMCWHDWRCCVKSKVAREAVVDPLCPVEVVLGKRGERVVIWPAPFAPPNTPSGISETKDSAVTIQFREWSVGKNEILLADRQLWYTLEHGVLAEVVLARDRNRCRRLGLSQYHIRACRWHRAFRRCHPFYRWTALRCQLLVFAWMFCRPFVHRCWQEDGGAVVSGLGRR